MKHERFKIRLAKPLSIAALVKAYGVKPRELAEVLKWFSDNPLPERRV